MYRKKIFYEKLYLGESMKAGELGKIKYKIMHKPLLCGYMLICISQNPGGQLEIYQARYLAQKYYRENPPYVIGIAANHKEAVELIQKIVSECIKARGDCALKEYLLCGSWEK